MTTELNFTLKAGDTQRITVTVQNSNGTAKSLVGVKHIKWWAAKKVTSTTYVLQKSVGTGITVSEPAANGVLVISIAPNDTKLLFGEFYHEMEIMDSTDDIKTVLTGTMTIERALIPNPT